jgi:anaphase-promoting complex subunit 11
MTTRKRPSDTAVVPASSQQRNNDGNDTALHSLPNKNNNTTTTPKSRLRVRIHRFHGIAKWTWNAGDEDDVCGICQSAFEGVAPGVKYPGDECPVVFGKCGHAFHLQCVSKWLSSSKNDCPYCRAIWEFGSSTDQRRSETTTNTL